MPHWSLTTIAVAYGISSRLTSHLPLHHLPTVTTRNRPTTVSAIALLQKGIPAAHHFSAFIGVVPWQRLPLPWPWLYHGQDTNMPQAAWRVSLPRSEYRLQTVPSPKCVYPTEAVYGWTPVHTSSILKDSASATEMWSLQVKHVSTLAKTRSCPLW